jgi:hypothetical protein
MLITRSLATNETVLRLRGACRGGAPTFRALQPALEQNPWLQVLHEPQGVVHGRMRVTRRNSVADPEELKRSALGLRYTGNEA